MSTSALDSIIGNSIQSVSFDEASKHWHIHFNNDDVLIIKCLWRLLEGGFISATSEDHNQHFGWKTAFDGVARLEEVGKHWIDAVNVHAATGDIGIQFLEQYILQIIPISAGHIAWQFKRSDGKTFTATGGEIKTI